MTHCDGWWQLSAQACPEAVRNCSCFLIFDIKVCKYVAFFTKHTVAIVILSAAMAATVIAAVAVVNLCVFFTVYSQSHFSWPSHSTMQEKAKRYLRTFILMQTLMLSALCFLVKWLTWQAVRITVGRLPVVLWLLQMLVYLMSSGLSFRSRQAKHLNYSCLQWLENTVNQFRTESYKSAIIHTYILLKCLIKCKQ